MAVPVKRREIFGWAMFDFANSSYTTVVISVVYSAFFVGYIVPEGSAIRDTYWSLAMTLSTLLALVLSPLAGAICDYSGRKKTYLVLTALVCALGTIALSLAGPGQVAFAIVLIVISSAAFMLSETFISAFLPEISTPRTMGKISGLGWGIGYFGGLLSIIVATQVIIRSDPASETASFIAENQRAMVGIGLFFLVAAIPTFVLLRNRSQPAPGYERAGPLVLLRAGLREFSQSMAVVRRYPILFQFLAAFMVYMAGLDAIVKFVGIYAREEVRLSVQELSGLFIVLQLSAAGGAFLFGWLEGKIGPKNTVLTTLVWWIIGVLGIYFLPTLAAVTGADPKRIFLVLGLFAGAGIGATQASSRTVVGLLAPPGRVSQMFGFWSMFSRLGSILGMSFGYLADGLGSRRTAILLIVGFFAVGAMMLSRVDIDRGIREAHGPGSTDRG
jgi:UMF1 family MFS transporter